MSTEDFTAAVRAISDGLDRREREIASLKDELQDRENTIAARDRIISTLYAENARLTAELVKAGGLPI